MEGDLAKDLSYGDGAVKLEAENLRLKRGTLDELGLSISVRRGFLKTFKSSQMVRRGTVDRDLLIPAGWYHCYQIVL